MAARKTGSSDRSDGASQRDKNRAVNPRVLAKAPAPEEPPLALVPQPGEAPTVEPVGGTGAVEDQAAEREPGARRFPIVGIGASAGGLEALQEFFGHMPSDSGMAFVVVTHQHPGHVSMLPNLLSKVSQLAVVEAHDGLKVEPNRVYVGPPGGLLAISNGVLQRLDAESGRAPHLPIDYFFRCLAADQREHAICVVLSGTGTDGTLGMRAIKAESGMAMVQDVLSAKYGGMPSSASATGLADYVLAADAMPEQLIAYAKGPYLEARLSAAEVPSFSREPLQRIVALLRTRTGHDFGCYKTTTIWRRIERRMNVHQINEPEGYIRFLQQNPHEIDRLFTELLISVTSFFRDPQAFEVLAEKALPELLKARSDEHTLRVWVPGCATGEEAYSVAIVIQECMEQLKRRWEVQVFGTDLDSHAIEAARAGLYAGGITADVSRERLDRYFTREDSLYRIRKDIREMLVFAPQNVIRDPPFTKLDLIVCRNLLIYLDVEAQRRLLPVLHYALRPQGLLFLGPSESISGFGEQFEVVDAKAKIFRRKETVTAVHPVMELPLENRPLRPEEGMPAALAAQVKQSHTVAQVERLLLTRFAPASVVVDERGNIVYIHGRTGLYLEPSEGQPRHNIVEMARQGLARPLAVALRQATVEQREVTRENVRVKTNGEFVHVSLSVAWIDDPETLRGLLLVTIRPAAPPASPPVAGRRKRRDAPPGRIEELEQELRYVKESLQTTIEELETSNEELKSTNEELQSTNEELQSTNEELETSKEEMQSLNEELSTVNTELEAKVEELTHATDDMQNLLNSTHVATVFLDNELNVKRYTEQAKELINLIQTDMGRPLSHLACKLEYDRLIDDCQGVLRTLVRKEVEVRAHSGTWHLMRIMPYRTADNVIDGVVLTFVDVTRLKEAENAAVAVCQCFVSIVETVRSPLLMLDTEFRVVAANEAYCRLFGTSPPQAVGKEVYEVGHRDWDSPPARRLLDQVAQQGVVSGCKLGMDLPTLGPRVLLVNARRLEGRSPPPAMMVLSIEDISPEKV